MDNQLQSAHKRHPVRPAQLLFFGGRGNLQDMILRRNRISIRAVNSFRKGSHFVPVKPFRFRKLQSWIFFFMAVSHGHEWPNGFLFLESKCSQITTEFHFYPMKKRVMQIQTTWKICMTQKYWMKLFRKRIFFTWPPHVYAMFNSLFKSWWNQSRTQNFP